MKEEFSSSKKVAEVVVCVGVVTAAVATPVVVDGAVGYSICKRLKRKKRRFNEY